MTPVKSQPTTAQDKFRVSAKNRMNELGLSVTQLAARLDVSRVAASQAINHGLHGPTRMRIAQFLSIPLQ